jgi:hypothetical protein
MTHGTCRSGFGREFFAGIAEAGSSRLKPLSQGAAPASHRQTTAHAANAVLPAQRDVHVWTCGSGFSREFFAGTAEAGSSRLKPSHERRLVHVALPSR